MKDQLEATRLWHALYGAQPGLIGVHSALRPAAGAPRLSRHRSAFFEYPRRAPAAADWCLRSSEEGLEAFFCAHLLTGRRRIKENSAPVVALWADADGGSLAESFLSGVGDPPPTAIVESSPGHAHLFWHLRRPISPEKAEELNRRLLLAVGGDRSGWDLSQLLRPPGTRNRKYEAAPAVRLLELDEGVSYHPRELDLALPSAQEPPKPAPDRASRPSPSPTDLSRLSARMRDLIAHGNATGEYASRSEADFAVAVAMFGADYDEAEVWGVLTDPANGISGKYREKGPHADGYLALTIGKAREVALPRAQLRGRRRVTKRHPAPQSKARRGGLPSG